MCQILVIGDDETVQSSLQRLFEPEGYSVQIAATVNEGLDLFRTAPPSVLLLDLLLLNSSEPEAFQQIQQLSFPIPLIVLGGASITERIHFLGLGADDFVSKPFSGRELIARVRAAIRRSIGSRSPEVFAFGDIRVDFFKMELSCRGTPVSLTSQEFRVLKFMIQNAGRVISRQELLNDVWGYQNYPVTRTVDNCIMKLRHKLEQEPAFPVHFLTIHGVGYKFVLHEEKNRFNRTQ